MDIQTGNPTFYKLLMLSAVTVGLSLWRVFANQRKLKRFSTTSQLTKLLPQRSLALKLISSLLLAAGVALLAVALVDIRWGKTTREVPQKGLEVVFALDVSRSMMAEDATPNRLERAKQQIKDMVDEMAGDRVALVVFAGEANQAVPLTSHYDDFKQELDTVGPHSVLRGGSSLGVAIQAAQEAFMSKTNEHRTIVLFTDGEDQESKPVELARKLSAENGTRIFTVGLGDLTQGARIPDSESSRNQFVQHGGLQVWSKLNGQILKQIARETDAAYIPAGTKRVNMSDVYHGYIAKIQKTEFETAKIDSYTPRFQWFAAAALLCLFLEAWFSSRVPRRHRDGSQLQKTKNRSKSVGSPAFTGFFVIPLLLASDFGSQSYGQDESVASKVNAANELVRNEKTGEAIDAFTAITLSPNTVSGIQSDQINYNLAVAHYRNSDYPAAKSLFEHSARSIDGEIAANSRFNLGNCLFNVAKEDANENPEMAIEGFKRAIAQYRSSLRLDRKQEDARANIELAAKMIRDLKQQQQEKEQNKEEEGKDKKKENREQQGEPKEGEKDKDQNDQSEERDPKHQQDGSSEKDPKKSGENEPGEGESGENDQKSSEDTSEPSDSNSQAGEDQEGENNNTASDDGQPENQESTQAPVGQTQQQPSSNNQNGNPEHGDQQDEPKDATGESKEDQKKESPTKGDLTAANQSVDQQQGTGQQAMQNGLDQNGVLTKQEALKMLQAVRDRDMLRRVMQQRRQRYRRIPVDKDW